MSEWSPPGGPPPMFPPHSSPPSPAGPPQSGPPYSGPPLPVGPPPAQPVLTRPAPPPRSAARPLVRVDPVPGTPFAVGYLDVPPATSGPAIGSLVTGIGALLAVGITGCFGTIGAQGGAAFLAAGAFAVPTIVLGVAGIGLGMVGIRQVRQAVVTRIAGRGMAIAGLVCGASALVLLVGVLALTLFA